MHEHHSIELRQGVSHPRPMNGRFAVMTASMEDLPDRAFKALFRLRRRYREGERVAWPNVHVAAQDLGCSPGYVGIILAQLAAFVATDRTERGGYIATLGRPADTPRRSRPPADHWLIGGESVAAPASTPFSRHRGRLVADRTSLLSMKQDQLASEPRCAQPEPDPQPDAPANPDRPAIEAELAAGRYNRAAWSRLFSRRPDLTLAEWRAAVTWAESQPGVRFPVVFAAERLAQGLPVCDPPTTRRASLPPPSVQAPPPEPIRELTPEEKAETRRLLRERHPELGFRALAPRAGWWKGDGHA